MKKILIYIAIVLAIIGLSYRVDKLKNENRTYQANQAALLDKAQYYQTENDKSAAAVQKLTLTVDELKGHYEHIKAAADELSINLKRIQSASTAATHTELRVITDIRDSVVYRDRLLDTIKCFNWEDTWMKVHGEIGKDSVDMTVESTDTIVQIIHRIPHKWWFFKWGTKAIQQEIISKNPHNKITYTDYIELK